MHPDLDDCLGKQLGDSQIVLVPGRDVFIFALGIGRDKLLQGKQGSDTVRLRKIGNRKALGDHHIRTKFEGGRIDYPVTRSHECIISEALKRVADVQNDLRPPEMTSWNFPGFCWSSTCEPPVES